MKEDEMSIFGFEIKKPGEGGDFLPIIKYDARAGRMFRVDSVQNTGGSWDRTPHDITATFKALFDMENTEVGWINFAGGTPSFIMVPYPGHKLPNRPSPDHKHGLRFTVKLANTIGGDVRQIAGTSASFLNGMEALYKAYDAEKAQHPGMLPAVILESTMPVTTGSGQKQSTNYQPVFKIVAWVPRPADLLAAVQGAKAVANNAPSNGAGFTHSNVAGDFGTTGTTASPPATGSQRASAPTQPMNTGPTVSASDFG
jgi:hypothetical protein